MDVYEIIKRPGLKKEVSGKLSTPAGFGSELIAIPQGSELEVEARFEAVIEGILVSGNVYATARGECGRCLEEFELEVEQDLQELYFYPERIKELQADGDEVEDFAELETDLIDLEPLIRDGLIGDLPFQPLCKEDCLGLCQDCGIKLEDNPDHSHENLDPRWAALSAIIDPNPESADKD